ncbi:MAG: hypothetical protein ACYC4Q_03200, partial [Victivallaceae bacterium]
AAAYAVWPGKARELDIQKTVEAKPEIQQEAKAFVEQAISVLNRDGKHKFKKLWGNVDMMQYSENMKSLEPAPADAIPEIIKVVSPKTVTGKVYAYARYIKLDYDLQFVLVDKQPGWMIAGIYESREYR